MYMKNIDIFAQQGVSESYKTGKFVDFGYGVEIRLSSTRSPSYTRATQRYLEANPKLREKFVKMNEIDQVIEYNRKSVVKKPVPEAPADTRITDEEASALTLHSLVYGCIHDWRGVRIGEAEVPFSKEEAIKLLGDPRLEVFLNKIVTFVNDLSNFESSTDDLEVDSLKKN